MKHKQKTLQLKPTTQKVLLLLMGGSALALSASPVGYFSIIGVIVKAWKEINRRALHSAIKSLYRSKLIDAKDNPNGSVTIVLTENGKKCALRYDIETIKIPTMKKWDGKWRVILFDIPEKSKKARNALAKLLQEMGCVKFQKSVFVCPYECKKEVDFVIEFFNLRPYVRYMIADHIDNELDFKRKFDLL